MKERPSQREIQFASAESRAAQSPDNFTILMDKHFGNFGHCLALVGEEMSREDFYNLCTFYARKIKEAYTDKYTPSGAGENSVKQTKAAGATNTTRPSDHDLFTTKDNG